ncbi:MAG: TIGR04283 family arsenosugar biosynthesis glycosyltransferase [Deltaproteobacteria bacterium]|nr:TIGR04283 family arsenosugar biosynthesis glycosyltransferase [Deltaproteobacteria bacterium]
MNSSTLLAECNESDVIPRSLLRGEFIFKTNCFDKEISPIIRRHPHSDRVIVFSRYPVPGRAKTRLIPALGPAGAADLQRRLIQKTIKTVRRFCAKYRLDVEVHFEGGSTRKMRRWLGSGLFYSRQSLGDLGIRMQNAFSQAFRHGGQRVVLLGTDVPEFTTEHLRQAFEALTETDLVLGPSLDGGYWLIGLKRPASVFHGIDWGTEAVLRQTAALAKDQGIKLHFLDPLMDIDTIEDLTRLMPGEVSRSPYVSVIIPAKNESANIEATVRCAKDEDVEIIVVDGESTDDTMIRASAAGAHIVPSSPGRARQQNRGAAIARGRVLLFLHADTILPGGFVDHVFDTLIDPKTVLGAFRFKTDLNHPLMKVFEPLVNFRSVFLQLPYGDQALFLRKSVFERIGGFPDVPIAEDLLLVSRLAKQGRIRTAPVAAITSGRRWRERGVLLTTLINYVILAGYFLNISPHVLASIYKDPRGQKRTAQIRDN